MEFGALKGPDGVINLVFSADLAKEIVKVAESLITDDSLRKLKKNHTSESDDIFDRLEVDLANEQIAKNVDENSKNLLTDLVMGYETSDKGDYFLIALPNDATVKRVLAIFNTIYSALRADDIKSFNLGESQEGSAEETEMEPLTQIVCQVTSVLSQIWVDFF